MNSPCKDCTKRTFGCHSECAEYNEYSEHCVLKRKERLYASALCGYITESISAIEHRKHLKKRK